jgi:uncharacterized membrane protein
LDSITVIVTSQADLTVENSASCIARSSTQWGVYVAISPSEKSGGAGENVTFTVTVTNLGDQGDNYEFLYSRGDWENFISPSELSVPAKSFGTATLTIRIPSDAAAGTYLAWVKAYSSHASYMQWCYIRVPVARGVGVSISPDVNYGKPGENVTFSVRVTNTGKVDDNYYLSASDSMGWDNLRLNDNTFTISAGENRTTTLRIHIPNNAVVGTSSRITVTATSRTDVTIGNSGICMVSVIPPQVRVSISPSEDNAAQGEALDFAVTVTNMGTATYTFTMTASDIENWGPTISPTPITLAGGASRTGITLSVTVPSTATEGDSTMITVTATSQTDNAIENSATCTAYCRVVPTWRGVQVTISPSEDNAAQGEALDFTVTVKNTGELDDTYDLTVSDDALWGALLDEDTLTILAHENTTVTVSVTVPSDAAEGDSTMITVTATSRGDPTVSDSATCTTTAAKAPPSPSPIVPIAVGGVVIVGGFAVVIVLLLKRGIIQLPIHSSSFACIRLPTVAITFIKPNNNLVGGFR